MFSLHLRSAGKGFVHFHVNYLSPCKSIETNLQAANDRRKEKAEKMAKNLIKQSLKAKEKNDKKKQQQEKKAAAKRKRKAARGSDSSEGSGDEATQQAADAAKTILEMAEQQQDKMDEVLAEHVAKIQIPEYIPLTRLATLEEKQSRSNRGMLMQQALRQAHALEAAKGKKTSAAEDERQSAAHQIGIKLCAEMYAKQCEENGISQGNQSKKGKSKKGSNNTKEKDDKETATQEVMKLGKHLLK